MLRQRTGPCRKQVIPGSRFSKFFSSSLMIQAVQNDDDVLKSKCSINLYFCPRYVAMHLSNCASCVLQESRDSQLQERKEE